MTSSPLSVSAPLRGAPEKWCSKCQKYLPALEFAANKKNADGLSKWCRECVSVSHKAWYDRNRARILERARKRERTSADRERSRLNAITYNLQHPDNKRTGRDRRLMANPKLEWAKQAIRNARVRAAEKQLPFDIDVEDVMLITGDTCPVLGIALAFPNVGRRLMGGGQDSPSIDRIRNDQGYVRGNIAVISRRANMIKSDANIDEIKAVVAWMEMQKC